jgi:hypothetical protein
MAAAEAQRDASPHAVSLNANGVRDADARRRRLLDAQSTHVHRNVAIRAQ